jgi:hypothetical protein
LAVVRGSSRLWQVRQVPLLQPAHPQMHSMEHGRNTSMIPTTHIETSPVMRMNLLLDERVTIPETDVMNKCEFYEKFINELTPYMTKNDELDARDGLVYVKIQATLALQGKKNTFSETSRIIESGLRRLKNELETNKVIR